MATQEGGADNQSSLRAMVPSTYVEDAWSLRREAEAEALVPLPHPCSCPLRCEVRVEVGLSVLESYWNGQSRRPPDPTSERCWSYSTIQPAVLQRYSINLQHHLTHSLSLQHKVTLTVQACNLETNCIWILQQASQRVWTSPSPCATPTDSVTIIYDIIWIPRVCHGFSSQMKGRRKQVWSFSISTTDWLWLISTIWTKIPRELQERSFKWGEDCSPHLIKFMRRAAKSSI